MDTPAESSGHAEHPNTRRHATFDLAEPPSRVPPEEGTDKEGSYEGETKIHSSEDLDDQESGVKRSSTHPFSGPEGQGPTSEPVRFKTPLLHYGHKRNKVRAPSKSKIFAYRPPAGRIKMDSSPLPRSSYRRSGEGFRHGRRRHARPQMRRLSSDDSSDEDTDSDILSADEDSASDAVASSSLTFDFSSIAPRPETQDGVKTVPEAPVPNKPTEKKLEMYSETIHKILTSHYISSTSRRSDSTSELLVDRPIGTQDNQSGYLMRWMYVLSTIKLQYNC